MHMQTIVFDDLAKMFIGWWFLIANDIVYRHKIMWPYKMIIYNDQIKCNKAMVEVPTAIA